MKRSSIKNSILVLLLILMVAMWGCTAGGNDKAAPNNDQAANSPRTAAAEYLAEIADMGPRVAGTETETKAGDWIKTTLEDLGYTVTVEPFNFNEDGIKGSSRNIIAVKEGTSDQTVVVGAHYDSVDIGNGVDDNGSGVAVVLEAAKMMKDAETPQTIEFIFFGAEEVGLCGSEYHVSKMTLDDISNTVLMINYDSLVAGDNAYVYGNEDAKGKFRDRALEIAKEKKVKLSTQPGENEEYPAGTTGDWSDHAAFKNAGIPYMYFESTNWSLGDEDGYTQVDPSLGADGEIWHTEFDTMDYINENFPDRITDRLTTFTTVTETILSEDLSSL